MAFKNESGEGVLFVAEDSLSMAVLPYSQEQLKSAQHPYQLPEPSGVFLRGSWKTAGIGNASCGPWPLEEYRLPFENFINYSYSIRPFKKNTDLEKTACLIIPEQYK